MKYSVFHRTLLLLLGSLLLITIGCGDAGTQDNAEQSAANQNDSEKSAPTTSDTPPGKVSPQKVTEAAVLAHIPKGYELLDWAKGDLNRDAHEDAVLIVKKSNEKETSDMIDHPEPRPVLVLVGDGNGQLQLAARNDNCALCVDCGGVFGDPYSDVVVKNGYFSVEHYGGSNWRWTRIMTFNYDDGKGKWFLHKDGGDSFHSSEPDKVETEIRTTKDFGEISFGDFHNVNS